MGSSSVGRVIAIHTSDRALYRGCRRRWLWGSHLNRGLEPLTKAPPLWFGEAVHYALKDFHGPRIQPTIVDSFREFVDLSYQTAPDRLPNETPELISLGRQMLEFYEYDWLERRDPLDTYILDGVPQVEIAFEIKLPVDPNFLDRIGAEKVVYRGTFDRIVMDDYGLLWIVEYKTAKALDTSHLATDAQVSAYCWAATCLYGVPVVGVIYQQHRKQAPKDPRILQSGAVSVAKNQLTTHKKYAAALHRVHGPQTRWSPAHIETLNMFARRESIDKDNFIQRTKLERNDWQIANEGKKIMLEVYEMLDPNTPMYASPTWTCGWCDFQSACVSADDGSDYEYELHDSGIYRVRTKASNEWETLAHQKLGGTLYHREAVIEHDRSGIAHSRTI